MTRRDYYQVLGIAREASPTEVRIAYARLARLHHPDQVGELTTRLAEVREAYRCLADPRARADHDRLVAEADRAHGDRQRRVAERPRRYDRRRPRMLPHPHKDRRGPVLVAVGLALAAGLWLRFLG